MQSKASESTRCFRLPDSSALLDNALVGMTLALFGLPILGDLLLRGSRQAVYYFAADAFYYLTVARNFADLRFFTFDQTHPTNGFHPLWQFLTAALYESTSLASMSDDQIMAAVLISCVVLIAVSLLLVCACFRRVNGHVSPFVVFLPVGLYPVLAVAVTPHRIGFLWSYANGMESALLLAIYALLLRQVLRPDFMRGRASALATGLILGCLTLSRLDHVFLPAVFLCSLLSGAIASKSWIRLRLTLLAGFVTAATISAYLLFNQETTGMWMPVSAFAKSTFPAPEAAMERISSLRASFPMGHHVFNYYGFPLWSYAFYRQLHLILPAVLGAVAVVRYLVIRRDLQRRGAVGEFEWMLAVTGGSCLLLGIYDFCFVRTFSQGHWYMPLGLFFMSIFSLRLLDRFGPFWQTARTRLAISGALALSVLLFFDLFHVRGWNQPYMEFFDEASRVREYYGDRDVKLVSYDDGIIAYAAAYPTLSGLGFTLDSEAARAKRRGRLLDLAYQRGYRLATSLVYLDETRRLTPETSPKEVLAVVAGPFQLSRYEARCFRFTVDYVSGQYLSSAVFSSDGLPQKKRFVTVRFEPRPGCR